MRTFFRHAFKSTAVWSLGRVDVAMQYEQVPPEYQYQPQDYAVQQPAQMQQYAQQQPQYAEDAYYGFDSAGAAGGFWPNEHPGVQPQQFGPPPGTQYEPAQHYLPYEQQAHYHPRGEVFDRPPLLQPAGQFETQMNLVNMQPPMQQQQQQMAQAQQSAVAPSYQTPLLHNKGRGKKIKSGKYWPGKWLQLITLEKPVYEIDLIKSNQAQRPAIPQAPVQQQPLHAAPYLQQQQFHQPRVAPPPPPMHNKYYEEGSSGEAL